MLQILTSLLILLNPVIAFFAPSHVPIQDAPKIEAAFTNLDDYKLPLSENIFLASQLVPSYPIRNWNTPDPQITAKIALVFETSRQKILWQKDGLRESRPIASLTKLMTAVIAKEIMLPDTPITLAPEDLLVEGHHQNLQAGDFLSLEEAFYLLLVSSDNSIAQALSRTQTTEPEFIAKMNQKANALGMTRTTFSNASGLNGNLSTPADLFLLARYINQNHPDIWSISAQPNITIITRAGKTLELKNTNALIGKVPGLIGGKTGYTPQAAGSLLLVFEVGEERLVSVVLVSSDRFGDTQKIISWYWQNYFNQ